MIRGIKELIICPVCSGCGLVADFWSNILGGEVTYIPCERCSGYGLILKSIDE